MLSNDHQSIDSEARRLLCIEPLDTLFFRDARPFSMASRAASGLPKPQTVAGALRTAMLRRAGIDLAIVAKGVRAGLAFADAAAVGETGAAIGLVRFRGPWFGQNGKILFPLPATLKKERDDDGAIVRLDPLHEDLPGWKPLEPDMKPLWSRNQKRLESVPGYLTEDGMTQFLDGGVPAKGEIVLAEDIYGFENRTGIALDAETAVADEGMIYAIRLLALRQDACLYVEVTGPTAALALFSTTGEAGETIALGGEGRRAIVTTVNNASPMPSSAMDGAEGRRLLVLTTAALVNGWCPDNLKLLAAAIPGHEAVSGWDLARGGPKPNRFTVAAGSVYFLRPDEKRRQSLTLGEDSSLGWGSYLEGVWNYV